MSHDQASASTCQAGTASSHTGCQMPEVRWYQTECGCSSQSCLPRGCSRSSGSSSMRTTTSNAEPALAAAVTSTAKGVWLLEPGEPREWSWTCAPIEGAP